MKLLLTSLLVCSSILSLAQSGYQSTAGYRPPRHQTADTTTVRGERPLSATEVYMLKLEHKTQLQQKEVALAQANREASRAQSYVNSLNSEKDALTATIRQLQDSLSLLKQRTVTTSQPIVAGSSYTTQDKPSTTYTATDQKGIQRSITTTSGGGAIYSEINTKSPANRPAGRVYYSDTYGRCFYTNAVTGKPMPVSAGYCK